MSQDNRKAEVAKVALDYIEDGSVVGVGTGSTVGFFIEELAQIKGRIEGAVASSNATETLLKQHGIPVVPLNSVIEVPIYIDSADEATEKRYLIKGGGGALTREKIVATASKKFICMIEERKLVPMLGGFPLPIEVIPMAQSYVARELVKLGGQPELRHNYMTDNGNIVLDIHNLHIDNPIALENTLNQIAGIVTNGLFASRPADLLLVAYADHVATI